MNKIPNVVSFHHFRSALKWPLFLLIFLAITISSKSQISLTTPSSAYNQNFNSLSNSGTSSSLPFGWLFNESGGSANTTYSAGTGSSNSGDTYSFGASGNTDRALGGLRSGNLVPTFGVYFVNNTGTTITSLAISYTGEMWRLGNVGRNDQLDFQYSLNATSLISGTWTDVDNLDFTTPNNTVTFGSRDGNNSQNRTSISAIISGISIPNGATFFLKWNDFDVPGSDDGLAIDEFSLTPIAAGPLSNLSINDVSSSEGNSGSTNYNFTVSLSSPAPAGGVTFDIGTANGTAFSGSDYTAYSLTSQTIPAGSSSYNFTVSVNGDADVEANETFFVNVTNVTGANVTDVQGQGTIVNDDVASPCQTSDAGAAVYNTGWSISNANDNADGFGPWQLSPSSNSGTSGFFVASSDINTGGRSWGMYANSGNTASATRQFASPLSIGNTLSFSIDNGNIQNGGSVGFYLLNSSGAWLTSLFFNGGDGSYILQDANFTVTNVGFTSTGLDISIVYTAANTYSIFIKNRSSGVITSYTGRTFNNQGNQVPDRINFFNSNAGSGSEANFFVNSLELNKTVIINQPSTSSQTVCANTAATALSVTAYGAGLLTYQWYSNTANANSGGTLIPDANSSSYTPLTTTVGTTYYYCVVTGECGAATSNVSGAITVTPNATVGAVSINNTQICAGSTVSVNLSGLIPNSTSNIKYNIGGAATQTVAGVVADGSGTASFTSIALTAANSGQTLTITEISRTDLVPACGAVTLTGNNTATLPTVTAGAIITCPSDINLVVDNSCSVTIPSFVGNLQKVVLANSSADFTGTQGNKNWYYGQYFAFQSSNFAQLPNWTGFVWKDNQAFETPFLDANGGHPGVNDLKWAVRRWVSNYSGSVTIQTEFYDRNTGCGDGVNVRVFKNGTEIAQYLNVPGTLTFQTTSVNLVVGDILDFVIDPKFDAGCDDTHFRAGISATTGGSISSNCGIKSVTQSPLAGTVVTGAGTTPVTITVVDNNDNVSTCTFNIVRIDNVKPVKPTIPNATAECAITVTAPTTTDNCAGTVTGTTSDPTTFNTQGTFTINWTFNDGNGNTETATQTVIVKDVTSPVAKAKNITVQLSAAGTVTITPAQVNDNSTDNCGIQSISLDKTTFNCSNLGDNNVVLTVTDVAGNTNTANAVVKVEDVTAPTVFTKNITVQLDASGNASVTPADVNNGSSDICGPVTLTNVTPSSFTCDNVKGSTTNELIISEYIEGSSNNKAIEIYNGTGAPVDLGAGGYNIFISFNGGTSTTSINLTGTIANGDVFVFAASTSSPAILAVADQMTMVGLFNGDDAVVLRKGTTVIDVIGRIGEDPGTQWGTDPISTADNTLRRKFSVLQGDNNGNNAFMPSQEWDGFANDDFSDLGKHSVGNIVTLTVTDGSGNTNTGVAYVKVEDNITPTVVTQSVTVYLDATGNGSTNAAAVNNGSSDNCSIAKLSLSQTNFTCSNVGENTVTLTVTDVNGNTATGTAVVTVIDNINPVTALPTVAAFYTADAGDCDATLTLTATATDNCGIASIKYYINYGTGTEAEISFPYNFTVGATVVTVVATDVNNNTDTDTYTVVVVDNQNPVITLPTVAASYSADAGDCDATLTLTATATDNCGIASIKYYINYGTGSQAEISFPYNFPVGSTTVTVVATDVNNLTDVDSYTVVVEDKQNPVTTLPTVATSYNADNGACHAALTLIATATDNCGTPALKYYINYGTGSQAAISFPYNFPVGSTIVTVVATDVNGLTDTDTYTVKVVDNQNPVTILPTVATSYNMDAGECRARLTLEASATDNCSIASIKYYINYGTATEAEISFPYNFTVGSTVVTVVATDVNNNTDTDTYTVVVVDNQNPVITLPTVAASYSADAGDCDATLTLTATATDNCGIASIKYYINYGTGTEAAISFPYNFPVGSTTVTVVATDVNNLTDVDSYTVVVEDKQNPVTTLPTVAASYSADAGDCDATLTLTATATDNCGIASIKYYINYGTGTEAEISFPYNVPVGSTTVTVVATDVNGLTDTDSYTVVVVDTQNPVTSLPTVAASYNMDAAECRARLTLTATATDNCSVATIKYYINYGTGSQAEIGFPYNFTVGATAVTVVATDVNGLTDVDTYTVNVLDNQNPVITLPTVAASYNTDAGECNRTLSFTANASDNCSVSSIKYYVGTTEISFPYDFEFGITTVTVKAVDANGNETTSSFNVNVNKVTTITTLTVSPNTQQYSDRVTFTATITPYNCSGAGDVGGTVDFKIGSFTIAAAVPVVNGVATITVPLLETSLDGAIPPAPPAGPLASYPTTAQDKIVSAVITGTDADYLISNPSNTTLTITQEDARLDYIGTMAQATPSITTSTATVQLQATVLDITALPGSSDNFAGDIRNARVMFVNRDDGNAPLSGWLTPSLIDPTDSKIGVVTANYTFDIGNANANSYTVGIIVDNGYYLRNEPSDNVVVTVYKPLGDFVTGGGYIVPSQSSGTYASTPGLKMNFGLNVKFNKRGTNLQGGVNMIFRRNVGGVVRTYQIKSNSMTSLGVSGTSDVRLAEFLSKSNLTDITNPLSPVSLGGNLDLRVIMTDKGEPGSNDEIGVTLFAGNGSLLFSSNWVLSSTQKIILSGGNIVVRSDQFAPSVKIGAITVKPSPDQKTIQAAADFNVKVLGNPSISSFRLQLQSSDKQQKITVKIVDVSGRIVEVKENLYAGQVIEVGAKYTQGTYFAEVMQGANRKTVKLLKVARD